MKPARALLVAALAAAACARPAPRVQFLNFDPESTAGALGPGWSGFEKTPAGDTFVWALSREATVRVEAHGAADRLVRFRAWPFGWDGAPPQTVAVAVNGVRLAGVTLAPGPAVYGAASPAAAWKDGENTLSFAFAWAEAPKDRLPGAGDARTLAAAFDWVEVVPVPAAGSRRP